MLDLSIMMNKPCAVLCDSPDKAEALYSALKEYDPKLTEVWERCTIKNFNWDVHESETCYTVYDGGYDGKLTLDRLYYCPRSYYESNGYEVISYDDLCVDEVELAESDIPLEEFLGI